jgi:hypothetical protein
MLLTVLRWSVRGSPEAAHRPRPRRPQPAPYATNIHITSQHKHKSLFTLLPAKPDRSLKSTTTESEHTSEQTSKSPPPPPAKRPCRSKTALKTPSAARSAASPPPLPGPERPLLSLLLLRHPLPLSRRHQKSRSPYQRPWHQGSGSTPW